MNIDSLLQDAAGQLKIEISHFDGRFSDDLIANNAISMAARPGLSYKEKYWIWVRLTLLLARVRSEKVASIYDGSGDGEDLRLENDQLQEALAQIEARATPTAGTKGPRL